jgi:NADH:ubiquinone oxidoreductase subunit 5 (subunit L)/multisubunit Na+/H+ antiporter MnhA subunit
MTRAAQGPLYTWLTDALEGPTPVVALIHGGTMVTAGVYVLARVFPILTPGVLILIAYVGLIGLIVGAVTALVQTDLRRILTAVTVSQVGFMLIGLGVGGWSATLFHLITYSIISALLFLGVGCVLRACNREGNIRKLGALAIKLPLTASSMLLGGLALVGMPFLSGWYSRDALLSQTLGFVLLHPWHLLLFVGPLVVAGVTAFVMVRMWVLVFLGLPRDVKMFLQADEPDAPMAYAVVFLSLLAVSVAWGWPPWDPDASWLEARIRQAQPVCIQADYGTVPEIGEVWEGGAIKPLASSERLAARHYGAWAMLLALLASAAGATLAVRWYFEPITIEQIEQMLTAAMPRPQPQVRPIPRPMPRPMQRPRLVWGDEDEDEEVPLGADLPVTPTSTPIPVKTGTSTPAKPKEREPAAWEVLLQRGFYLDWLYPILFVAPLRWLGWRVAWFDRHVLEDVGEHVASATVTVAKAEGQVDTILDKTVRETARSVWNLGGFLRRAQTGSLRGYLLCLVLAAVGIVVAFALLATVQKG